MASLLLLVLPVIVVVEVASLLLLDERADTAPVGRVLGGGPGLAAPADTAASKSAVEMGFAA